ncbi:MAG: glycosyltransferase family 4 protein [Janthinobacterium lividum]
MDSEQLRILFLADAVAEDLPGGSRTAARELARGLTERGHRVTFLVGRQNADAPEDETRNGVRIVRYAGAGKAGEYVRQGQEACAKLMHETSFDLAHTHFAYAGLGPLRALPNSIPRVRTFHGPWDEEGWIEDTQCGTAWTIKACVKRCLRRQIERGSLKSSAKVLTLSQCFKNMTSGSYGVSEQRVKTIPGGADTNAFYPAPDKTAVRRELGLPLEGQILLSIRRLVPRMGLDRLIQAMPEVIARCPNTRLLIGGQGPEEARLQTLISTLRLDAHVRLIGFIPSEKLAAYYQAADLFVMPTLALEGFGLVTTEALACGLAVVGTPIGATPEILIPLDQRLIARSPASHDLADAVAGYLLGDWRQALAPKRLHEYVQRNYTWDQHVSRTEQVYWDLISSLEPAEHTKRAAILTSVRTAAR